MVNATYFVLEDIKDLLGETGDTNNAKISRYGFMADNKINIALAKIKDPTTGDLVLPFTTVPQSIHDLSNALTLGYFYKFESGSVDILEQALSDLLEYIDNTYRRINFATAGAAI